jgi:SPP1 family phage portal protein
LSDLILKLKETYYSNLYKYTKMYDYYKGDHDILKSYRCEPNRANDKRVVNMVMKFIEEEIAYTFGNPTSYVSKSANNKVINDIDYNLYHWQATHNQELMRQVEIYGTAYELYYINTNGEFCGRILNPSNAIVYTDTDNIPQIFIHFYKKPYDDANYYDVYYADRIEIYKDDVLVDTKSHIFSGVPVSICSLGEEQTIYSKIKSMQDALNQLLSDQINIISDYKAAYLVVTGAELDGETAEALKTKGILNLSSKDSSVNWLMKEMNDQYIKNMIDETKENMYSICNHLNGNERLQSNTSGVALRQRLVFLEQRCKTVFDAVSDTLCDRMKFLFEYLSLKNINYDWKDIAVNFNPCVPQDLSFIAQVLTQLDGKISLETALGQIPFIENVAEEIEKLKKEHEELYELDLSKIDAV